MIHEENQQVINYNAGLERMWSMYQVKIQNEKDLLMCVAFELSPPSQYKIERGLSVIRDYTPVIRIVYDSDEEETIISFDYEEWAHFILIIENIIRNNFSTDALPLEWSVSEEIYLSMQPLINCVNVYRADSWLHLNKIDIESIIQMANGILVA